MVVGDVIYRSVVVGGNLCFCLISLFKFVTRVKPRPQNRHNARFNSCNVLWCLFRTLVNLYTFGHNSHVYLTALVGIDEYCNMEIHETLL
jgi:hypothetical protein